MQALLHKKEKGFDVKSSCLVLHVESVFFFSAITKLLQIQMSNSDFCTKYFLPIYFSLLMIFFSDLFFFSEEEEAVK